VVEYWDGRIYLYMTGRTRNFDKYDPVSCLVTGCSVTVTNHVYWREALAQLPADWVRRNLQVVLATLVIHKAGPPKVLAVHWW
jgi:hypothetical protein